MKAFPQFTKTADAEHSTTAPESYTRIKKRESHDTGVTKENTVPKEARDRTRKSGQLTTGQSAGSSHDKLSKPYLALSWQPVAMGLRHTSMDRRFPTPPQRRNSRQTGALVTTSHLFWPNQRRNAAFSLRFWLPNSLVLVVNVTTWWPGGRGDQLRGCGQRL